MQAKWAIVRGSVIGFFLGILPGGGAVIASFVSYAMEKKVSKHPEKFGTGVIEGVAAPGIGQQFRGQGSFIPLLTLGIPPNVVMAILLGALIIHGVTPGPAFDQHPDVFWGVVASMYMGNVMLLILNLPLIGMWVQLLKVPYAILLPLILLFCLIGSYSIASSIIDICFMIFFGVVGYLMKKLRYEAPPCPGLCPGAHAGVFLKSSLMVSQGSFEIFFTRPISAGCLIITLLLLFLPGR